MNILILIIIGAAFIGLKFWYASAGTDSLAFLLDTTAAVVRLVTGCTSRFIEGQGHYFSQLDMIISKPCSGFNFLLLCSLMLSIHTFISMDRTIWKIASISLVPLLSLAITILANASRICCSVLLGPLMESQRFSAETIHESIGVFCYLAFLISSFLITDKLISKISNNECSTES